MRGSTTGGGGVSLSLLYYHELIGTSNAFQLAMDAEYVDADCFARKEPV